MVALGVAVTALLTLGMLARGASLEEAFLVGVSVAVAAVPEGLAATVTIALAQGARAMAGRGAIVRRLAAVETLGAATVVAADKTGTLTINQLRVAVVEPEEGRTRHDVLEAAVLASTADLVEDEGVIRVAGDPVDGAFLLALAAEGGADPRTSDGRTLVRALPFDPWRKRLTTVYEEDGWQRVLVKGAPETLIERSRLGAQRRRELLAEATDWASDGLRVLAVGQRVLDREGLGAGGRASTATSRSWGSSVSAIRFVQQPQIRSAAPAPRGVEVAILTGDHPVTAAAIARALELPDGIPLTGPELEELDEMALGRALRDHSVFARVTPADKLRLVEALQSAGHVVAVTGDGINDTPALRRADVGVAMGYSGTEAAREAADVVLTDDDFATIVTAIGEGRRIAQNIRNFVAFLLSANFGEVVLFAIAILAGIGAPMTVVQVLTVNLLTDGLPAVALTRDPASEQTLRSGPRGHGTLFPRRLQLALVLMGIAVGLTATAAYVIGRATEPAAAQTMAFATLAMRRARPRLLDPVGHLARLASSPQPPPAYERPRLVRAAGAVDLPRAAPRRVRHGAAGSCCSRHRGRSGRCTVGLDGGREGRPPRARPARPHVRKPEVDQHIEEASLRPSADARGLCQRDRSRHATRARFTTDPTAFPHVRGVALPLRLFTG